MSVPGTSSGLFPWCNPWTPLALRHSVPSTIWYTVFVLKRCMDEVVISRWYICSGNFLWALSFMDVIIECLLHTGSFTEVVCSGLRFIGADPKCNGPPSYSWSFLHNIILDWGTAVILGRFPSYRHCFWRCVYNFQWAFRTWWRPWNMDI